MVMITVVDMLKLVLIIYEVDKKTLRSDLLYLCDVVDAFLDPRES
jgi:hypothetical protein